MCLFGCFLTSCILASPFSLFVCLAHLLDAFLPRTLLCCHLQCLFSFIVQKFLGTPICRHTGSLDRLLVPNYARDGVHPTMVLRMYPKDLVWQSLGATESQHLGIPKKGKVMIESPPYVFAWMFFPPCSLVSPFSFVYFSMLALDAFFLHAPLCFHFLPSLYNVGSPRLCINS